MIPGNPNTFATLVLTLFALAFAAMWAFALVDLVRRADWEFPRNATGVDPRLLWSVIVVLFGGFGGLAYYVLVMRPYPRQPR